MRYHDVRMDSPVATITSLSGGKATVTVSRLVACARCAAGKGCGAGLLSGNATPAKIQVLVPESMRLRVGDQVTLELSPDNLLKASFLVYGLPLAGVVTVLIIGWLVAGPLTDVAAIGLAVAGLAAGMLIGRAKIRRNSCLEQFVPRISSRVASSTS
jgi:sigma-E factor negative regulatory protein RseC